MNQHDRADSEPDMTTTAQDLAHVLLRRRKELGLSQRDLADLAGCSPRFLRSLEQGKATVRLDKVLAVLDALGLECDVRLRRVS